MSRRSRAWRRNLSSGTPGGDDSRHVARGCDPPLHDQGAGQRPGSHPRLPRRRGPRGRLMFESEPGQARRAIWLPASVSEGIRPLRTAGATGATGGTGRRATGCGGVFEPRASSPLAPSPRRPPCWMRSRAPLRRLRSSIRSSTIAQACDQPSGTAELPRRCACRSASGRKSWQGRVAEAPVSGSVSPALPSPPPPSTSPSRALESDHGLPPTNRSLA